MKKRIVKDIKYTDIVKSIKTCYFVGLNSKEAIYGFEYQHKNHTFIVPFDDLGTGKLGAFEKPMLMARYIRKSIENQTLICEE